MTKKWSTAGGWLYHLTRLTLALVFIYAGAAKLADPQAFARVISEYGLAPEALLIPAAVGLPLLEILGGAGLLLEMRGSLALVAGLTAMFIGVLWFGVLRELNVDCGCFSAKEAAGRDALLHALYRDLFMLAGAAYLHAWRRAGAWAPPRRGIMGIIIAKVRS